MRHSLPTETSAPETSAPGVSRTATYRAAFAGLALSSMLSVTGCNNSSNKIPSIDLQGCHREYIAQSGDSLNSIATSIINSKGTHADLAQDLATELRKARQTAKGFSVDDATNLTAGASIVYLPDSAKIGNEVNC